MLTEAAGIPIAVAVAGANRHDIKLLGPTLEAIVVERPEPSEDQPQNLSGDRGYDFNTVRAEARQHGYVTHIRTRGEEIELKQHVPISVRGSRLSWSNWTD